MKPIYLLDFAGVVSTTSMFPRMAKMLSIKTGVDAENIEQALYDNEDLFLLGKQSPEEFHQNALAPLSISYRDFIEVFSTWYELREDMLEFIRSTDARFFIASDNFPIVSEKIRNDPALAGLFENMFFSNEMGVSKKTNPEEFFSQILESIPASPNECIFVDDKEENLAIPKQLGMHVFHFPSVHDLLYK